MFSKASIRSKEEEERVRNLARRECLNNYDSFFMLWGRAQTSGIDHAGLDKQGHIAICLTILQSVPKKICIREFCEN